MKKVFILITVLFIGLGLVACTTEETPVEDAAPTISGVAAASIKIGEAFDPYAGVTANDAEDGNLTDEISVQGFVDNTEQGTYTLTYVVMDSAKNVTRVNRTVTVTVGEAPVFAGVGNVTVTFEQPFNPRQGVSVTDVEDGNLTAFFTVTGSVNVSLVGTYTLTYSVTDSAGNTTTATRVVTVAYGDKVVVTFTSWNLGTPEQNNLLRRRIDAFNEESETIEIEIMEYTGSYDEFLATQAAAGTFPDVFISGNIPDHIMKGYAGELTSAAAADPEWLNIPVALRDSITYNGRVYAVPAALHYLGYFANLDLIEDSGVLTDFTELGYTYAEWIEAVEEATDSTKLDGTSTAGMNHPAEMFNWLPAVLDDAATTPLGIGHAGIVNGEFKYNSQAVKDALAQAKAIMDNFWGFEAWSDVDPDGDGPLLSPRVARYGSDWWASFNKGQVAFQWDGTWSSQGMKDNATTAGFDVQFIGVPGNKVVGVTDYYAISKTTEDLDAAYEVAKWLTFGTDGLNAMFDIIENTVPGAGEVSLSVSGLPISTVQSIVDVWFENYPVAGVQEIFEAAAAGTVEVLVEGNKFVPGFITARYTYNTGIDALISRPNNAPGSTLSIGDLLWDAQFGKLVYADHMTQELETLINYELLKAQLALEAAMNAD
ncbi:MAG TPA: extracellular solute-binding protein [Acholeplasmataceae bacterium]|nr:extracellular solute-binding protein [Acholeplasmataceae bacterium]